MQAKDKPAFIDAMTTTIQCVAGTMRPPATMLAAYYDALKDLELEQLLGILKDWQRNSNSWPSPAAIRTAIVGRPDVDSFDDYLDNYVSRGRMGDYKDPIGIQVVKELGGSGRFREMSTYDRADWKRRWVSAYRDIANGRRKPDAKVSTKPKRVQ